MWNYEDKRPGLCSFDPEIGENYFTEAFGHSRWSRSLININLKHLLNLFFLLAVAESGKKLPKNNLFAEFSSRKCIKSAEN